MKKHVNILQDREDKIKQIMKEEQISREEAEDIVQKSEDDNVQILSTNEF